MQYIASVRTDNGYRPSASGALVLERVREFIDSTARPLVDAHWEKHPGNGFPLESDGRLATSLRELKLQIQRASAAEGLYCPHLPEQDGGLGRGLLDCFFIQEAVYREGLRGVQWMLAWTDGPSPIVAHWSDEARGRHLADFLAGRSNVAFALTEPDAGSDFPSLTASARRDGDGWVLNGHKHLITGAPFCELAQVFARIDDAPRGQLTCFLVPLDSPGVERTLQPTIMADGQTGELLFEDVHLPDWAIIGQEGHGRHIAFHYINWTRTRRGGQGAGLAGRCFEQSVARAQTRIAFGEPIAKLGAVEGMLSDMYLDLSAMRALSMERLARLDGGDAMAGYTTSEDRRDVSVVKAFNDDALYRIADRAIQVHGGLGVLTETGLEHIFRVARNLRIPAGTAEIQRAMIAQSLLAAVA